MSVSDGTKATVAEAVDRLLAARDTIRANYVQLGLVDADADLTELAAASFKVVEGFNKKADKKIPSIANNVALLDSTGNLSDSGLQLQYGTWVPRIADVASYSIQTGSYAIIGKMMIINFIIYGTFSDSANGNIVIGGCPMCPVQKAAGGGYLTGYYAADNLVFSGWTITDYDGTVQIAPVTHWATAAGTKYIGTALKSAGTAFQASGTIAFTIA